MRRASVATLAVVAALSVMTITVVAAKKCTRIQAHCAVETGTCDPAADRSTTMTKVIRQLFSAATFRTI